MRALTRTSRGGFTLVELIMVIVILGILSAIAIPKLFDFSGDAKKAATLGILGGVRTAISLYFTKNALPPPTGGGTPWWPSLAQMQSSDGGAGVVMESKMADNPYSVNGTVDGRNNVLDRGVSMTSAGARPAFTAGNVGAWAYDASGDGLVEGQPYAQPSLGSDVGTFWANTSSASVGEVNF